MKASETARGLRRTHDRRAGAPTGRMTGLPTRKQAQIWFSRLTAKVLLFDKSSPNAFHIFPKEAYGLGSVAIEPGYDVGINDETCSSTAILTTSKTTSTPGARVRSLPVTADTSRRNSRLKRKEASSCTRQNMQTCVALPRVDTVEVRHQATPQENKGLQTTGSLLDVLRHLPNKMRRSGWSCRQARACQG